jgi:molybdopterin converting factor small subunit
MEIVVQIRVMGSLKDVIGQSLQKSLTADSTISDLLWSLSNEFDQQIKKKFARSLVELYPTLFILLNDVDISLFEEEHTKLSEGDIITILPIVHGG